MNISSNNKIKKLFKLGKYGTWSFFDQIGLLGLTRLVLFPVLAGMLDKDSFGILVIAIGFVNMIGVSPSTGFSAFVLREAAKYSLQERALLIRTMILMSCFMVLPFGMFFVFCNTFIASRYGLSELAYLLPAMGMFLIFLNISETPLVFFRIRRKFEKVFFAHFIQGLLYFSSIPLYLAGGLKFVCYGWVIGAIGQVIFVTILLRKEIFARPIFDIKFAKHSMTIWWTFSLGSLLVLSAGRLDRLFLGYWWESKYIGGFFAAASIAAILTIPTSLASSLILSLLGGVKERTFWQKRRYKIYGISCIGLGIIIFIVGMVIGKIVIQFLYPDYFEEAVLLLPWVVGGAAFSTLKLMTRPFTVKFLNPKLMPALGASDFIAKIVPLLLLVPKGGAMGAAQSLFVSSAIIGTLRFSVYIVYFILKFPDAINLIDEEPVELEI